MSAAAAASASQADTAGRRSQRNGRHKHVRSADDLKRARRVGNVDRRRRDIGTGDNADATMVDRQLISCTWSRTIDDIVSGAV